VVRALQFVDDDPRLEEANEERGVGLDPLLLLLRRAFVLDAEQLVAALLQLGEDLVDELEVLLREAFGQDRGRVGKFIVFRARLEGGRTGWP
jgi:hypothetical protein